jgi:hypothetical protein
MQNTHSLAVAAKIITQPKHIHHAADCSVKEQQTNNKRNRAGAPLTCSVLGILMLLLLLLPCRCMCPAGEAW